MSKFILKKLHLFQIQPFSSSPSSARKSLNQSSFTVNYLINSCGLTPERAASASKHVKLNGFDTPNSVLAFFKDQGFTQTQISRVIHASPALLRCNPEKNILPKIQFLKSKGISGSDVAAIVSSSPVILSWSLEKRIMPTFIFLSNFLESVEKANVAFKKIIWYPSFDPEKWVKPNVEMLKQAGIPVRNIQHFVRHLPYTLSTNCDKFRRVMEEVKKMAFHPLELSFVYAIHALISMSKSTWDKKVEVYKHWGWSDDDIIIAFRKVPKCMVSSEDKINSIMEFLVNKMGLNSSFLAHRPLILSLSLEKRIVPRGVVYQALVSKGLIKPCDTVLTTMIQNSEKQFLERFISRHVDDAPDLLKLYKQKLDISSVLNIPTKALEACSPPN